MHQRAAQSSRTLGVRRSVNQVRSNRLRQLQSAKHIHRWGKKGGDPLGLQGGYYLKRKKEKIDNTTFYHSFKRTIKQTNNKQTTTTTTSTTSTASITTGSLSIQLAIRTSVSSRTTHTPHYTQFCYHHSSLLSLPLHFYTVKIP